MNFPSKRLNHPKAQRRGSAIGLLQTEDDEVQETNQRKYASKQGSYIERIRQGVEHVQSTIAETATLSKERILEKRRDVMESTTAMTATAAAITGSRMRRKHGNKSEGFTDSFAVPSIHGDFEQMDECSSIMQEDNESHNECYLPTGTSTGTADQQVEENSSFGAGKIVSHMDSSIAQFNIGIEPSNVSANSINEKNDTKHSTKDALEDAFGTAFADFGTSNILPSTNPSSTPSIIQDHDELKSKSRHGKNQKLRSRRSRSPTSKSDVPTHRSRSSSNKGRRPRNRGHSKTRSHSQKRSSHRSRRQENICQNNDNTEGTETTNSKNQKSSRESSRPRSTSKSRHRGSRGSRSQSRSRKKGISSSSSHHVQKTVQSLQMPSSSSTNIGNHPLSSQSEHGASMKRDGERQLPNRTRSGYDRGSHVRGGNRVHVPRRTKSTSLRERRLLSRSQSVRTSNFHAPVSENIADFAHPHNAVIPSYKDKKATQKVEPKGLARSKSYRGSFNH